MYSGDIRSHASAEELSYFEKILNATTFNAQFVMWVKINTQSIHALSALSVIVLYYRQIEQQTTFISSLDPSLQYILRGWGSQSSKLRGVSNRGVATGAWGTCSPLIPCTPPPPPTHTHTHTHTHHALCKTNGHNNKKITLPCAHLQNIFFFAIPLVPYIIVELFRFLSACRY